MRRGTSEPIQSVSVAALPGAGGDPVPQSRVNVSPDYAGEDHPRPALACAGASCLVAYTESGSFVNTVLFDRAGVVVRRNSAAATRPAAPALAWSGTEYLLVVQDARPSGTTDVMAQRFDPSNARVGTPFAVAAGANRATPAVAFDGARYLVVWEDLGSGGGDVLGARVEVDGTVHGEVSLSIGTAPGEQGNPAVAASASGALVAYTDTRTDVTGDVYATVIAATGEVGSPSGVRVSSAANREIRPAIAHDAGRWLVVWQDSRASGDHDDGIYAARVDADGTVLDPVGFVVADGLAREANPAVAGCGGRWIVAWEDFRSGEGTDVYAARVTADGAVPDPPGIPVGVGPYGQGAPAVGCAGGTALVAWQSRPAGATMPRGALVGARVGAEGAVLDATPLPISDRSAGGQPAVGAGEGAFLVAWQAVDTAGNASVLAARVGGDGAVGPEAVVCGGPSLRGAPDVAFDGAGYRVVFEDQRSAPGALRSVRLTAAGAPVDPCGVELRTGASGLRPRVGFDGARLVVIWRAPEEGALRGASLTPGGGVLETFDVAAVDPGAERPSLACDGAGVCVVAYDRTDPELGVSRARLRVLTSVAPAAGCAAAADCASGFCVDGVCCDSACGAGAPDDCVACSVAAGAPADGVCAPVVADQLCEARGETCAPARRCDGASVACPAAVDAADGTACDDGDACTVGERCQAGACTGGSPSTCPTGDACRAPICDPRTGSCALVFQAGLACDDGNACTEGDRCDATRGACAGTPKVCAAPDACHQAQCDPSSGACVATAQPDGTWCDDGDACTRASSCRAGVCAGTSPVLCPAPDACHEIGLCDRATGRCTYAPKADGTGCDDGNACTRDDACTAGVCRGGTPVTCTALDACHRAGTCNPGTGLCSNPPEADGTPCDDGQACTRADACIAGTCHGQALVCAPSDQCHVAGVCDGATGACSQPAAPDGTWCDDGDPCTQQDSCAAGACSGGTPVVCADPGPCRLAACQPGTGSCESWAAPDGTECTGGTCADGVCVPEPPGGGGGGGGGSGGSGGGCGCGARGTADLSPVLALGAILALARALRRRRAG
ncbi:MAG TPA: hypothetical protein VEB43_17530 [Anaeromyxobacter sp.]|nr:hypothetical protein [Anaeromyxobacter sp.]